MDIAKSSTNTDLSSTGRIPRVVPRSQWFGIVAVFAVLLLPRAASAEKFFRDDPLTQEPPPVSVSEISPRKPSALRDFLENTFARPGERHTAERRTPAQNVNTLGEVPDSAWFTNRHHRKRTSIAELEKGARADLAPCTSGQWAVTSAKAEGVTPGLQIKDCAGRKYLLKFDPLSNPEMASGAEAVATNFLRAIGYNVPENYIVYFHRDRLEAAEDAAYTDATGKKRKLNEKEIDEVLKLVPKDSQRGYRALASLFIGGEPIGPFSFHGTRVDDPNDIVPHEHRRELRGLYVFYEWLNQTDAKSLNTLDSIVEENGRRFVKHYLIDFGSSLGSSSTAPKRARDGHEYYVEPKIHSLRTFTAGAHLPRWARADFPDIPAVGNIEWRTFVPDMWKPNYPVAAFDNRLPDDSFWAAKQVMAFTDDEIRALVSTGQYSDPKAAEWIAQCLISRRDKIGAVYFSRVLPLDGFRVELGRLVFDDFQEKYDMAAPRRYQVRWARFNNKTEQKTPLEADATAVLPKQVLEAAPGEYFSADIHNSDPANTITVYVRKESGGVHVVGVERTWSDVARKASTSDISMGAAEARSASIRSKEADNAH